MSIRTKSTVQSIAPKPKAQPKATPTPPAPSHPVVEDLSEIQSRACELAGDLIRNGGNDKDVKLLLQATLRHHWQRQFRDWKEYNLATPQQYADGFLSAWYTDIVRHWPEKRPEPEAAMPTTVLEMARQASRNYLERVFEDFMAIADIENVNFLRRVLETVVTDECQLPDAFAWQIEAGHTWVKVQNRHKERVEQFAKLLTGDA